MSLKTKLATWQLNSKLRNRKRTICISNLNTAKTAGVLWNCDDQAAYKSLISILKKNNVEVSGFCLSDQPVSIQGEAVFSKQDFSWLALPKSAEVMEFVDKKFDLLIDISLSDSQETQAIRALSLAKFKAGWSAAEPDFFDLQIDVSQRQEPSFLAEQIVHYLNELNKE